MSNGVVETSGLGKRYGRLAAVDSLDLQVREGEIFGLLGPNGSGKTTTILMLLGLTEPTSGSARVAGHDPLRDPLAVKRVASYLPENVGFYRDLTAAENLRFTAELNGIPRREYTERIEAVLWQVRLGEAVGRPVSQFSRGMRQRLGIADALLKQPRVAFLDEPTIGLDPEGVEELLQLIVDMSRNQGITIFLSSHLLHQVQRICHRVGIMFRGRMVAEGPLEELGRVDGGIELQLEVAGREEELAHSLEQLPEVRGVDVKGSWITLECSGDVRGRVAQHVLEQGGQLLQLRPVDRTLQDIYMRYFHEAGLAAGE